MPMTPMHLADTASVCPVCLLQIPAQRIAEGDDIYLVKRCDAHGEFRTVVWRGLDSYLRWGQRGSRAAPPPVTETTRQHGCPHDCGLCPDHRQHTCCVLLEVTQACNLRCPVCFASAGEDAKEPSLAEIEGWLRELYRHRGKVNLQLSGGEPTVRDDLAEIVTLARSVGFDFVQLNTNGIRLAKEPGYARRLADAGLDCVFLQFDGISDEVYLHIRGARLRALKERAIARCAEVGLGIVLVPTLVPGVNIGEIGAIVDFAVAHVPAVRALHFQPMSYFGRYAASPSDADRITLPEVMRELERQTRGAVQVADLAPGSAENAYCSFTGKFFVGADGSLRPAATDNPAAGACCTGHADEGAPASSACGCGVPSAGQDAARARRFVAMHWVAPVTDANPIEPARAPWQGVDVASLDAFLATRRHSFCISAMAFQDAWTLDLERLRECFIHVAAPAGRIVPFCAYNLTTVAGEPLYRQRPPACATA